MNANGRRIDAWLIYKCLACENSWNRPLLERRNVGDIDPSMLRALQTNDPDLVRRIVFDVDDLRRRAERIEESAAVTIDKKILSGGEAPTRLDIALVVPAPTSLRADRMLANEFDAPRAKIQELSAKKRLTLFPHGAKMLRRPVRDGMRISIALSTDDDKATFPSWRARANVQHSP